MYAGGPSHPHLFDRVSGFSASLPLILTPFHYREIGSPLKIFCPESIEKQICSMQEYFQEGSRDIGYTGGYQYCYCTKSNHFAFILKEIFEQYNAKHPERRVSIETSSTFDMHLLKKFSFDSDSFFIHNGFKDRSYLQGIGENAVLHTGAYQENIGGGQSGLSHCQIQKGKILIMRDSGIEILSDDLDDDRRSQILGF